MRREWLPTPLFLPRKFHGQRSLVGYSPWSCKKFYMTEHTYFSLINIFKAINFPLPTTLTNSHRFSEVLLSTPNVALKSSQMIRKLFSALSTSLLLPLLSCFSRVRLCETPQTTGHQAPPSLGFSKQEHWSGLPFPSPRKSS